MTKWIWRFSCPEASYDKRADLKRSTLTSISRQGDLSPMLTPNLDGSCCQIIPFVLTIQTLAMHLSAILYLVPIKSCTNMQTDKQRAPRTAHTILSALFDLASWHLAIEDQLDSGGGACRHLSTARSTFDQTLLSWHLSPWPPFKIRTNFFEKLMASYYLKLQAQRSLVHLSNRMLRWHPFLRRLAFRMVLSKT